MKRLLGISLVFCMLGLYPCIAEDFEFTPFYSLNTVQQVFDDYNVLVNQYNELTDSYNLLRHDFDNLQIQKEALTMEVDSLKKQVFVWKCVTVSVSVIGVGITTYFLIRRFL